MYNARDVGDSHSQLVITVPGNKAFQNNESGDGYILNTNLKKDDFKIKLNGTELKDLSPQDLKRQLAVIPGFKIKPHLASNINKEKDLLNFEAKIQAVINHVNNNKSGIEALKTGDKLLIDKFLSNNADKYGNLDKTPITAEIIIKTPDKIQYLASSTETALAGKYGMTGREKDADDLLGFLKAVVESRTKFNKSFAELKKLANDEGDKTIRKASSSGINSIANLNRKGNVTDERYKYYSNHSNNGKIIKADYSITKIKNTKYVGFNPDNLKYKAAAADKDSQTLIKLMNNYASEFDSNVRQILITPVTNGGKKSRKVSKGGRRRKTRSNKFA